MSDTVHINAFQTSLHGTAILCQGPFPKSKLPPILESTEDLKAPFKRKVLLTNSPFAFRTLSLSYDATFQIREGMDWSLALTYILHAPKDVLVVVEDLPIPDAFWPKLHKSITVVHIVSAPLKNLKPYSTVLFAPIEELTTGYADTVFKALIALYKKTYSQQTFKELIQELKVAGASVAWTKIGEATTLDSSGSLYWYEPTETQGTDTLTKPQLADLFGWLSSQFK
jgi:hypothetical protein